MNAALVPLLFCASLVSGCESDATRKGTTPEAPTVQTDLARLRQLLRLPAGIERARFIVKSAAPSGSRLVPGPTDSSMLVWLQPSAETLSNPEAIFPGPPATFKLEYVDAEALLPPELMARARLQDNWAELNCTKLQMDFGTTVSQQRLLVRCEDFILGRFQGL